MIFQKPFLCGQNTPEIFLLPFLSFGC